MKTQATVEAFEWTTVDGKKTLYMRIEKDGQTHLMRIGKGTFDAINEMTNSKQQKLPLNETKK